MQNLKTSFIGQVACVVLYLSWMLAWAESGTFANPTLIIYPAFGYSWSSISAEKDHSQKSVL